MDDVVYRQTGRRTNANGHESSRLLQGRTHSLVALTASLYACVRVRACVRACVQACARKSVCACWCACGRAFVPVCMYVCSTA